MTVTIPEPTAGSVANSYELVWDINTGTPEAPVWTNIPDITGIAPVGSPKMTDTATYAHHGNDATSKTGETFTASFDVQAIRVTNGEYQAPLLALLALAAPETRGAAAVGHFRYYDELGASYAFEFTGTVAETRKNTGNADPSFYSFTITSRGDRKSIANPNKVVTP
jgi:hypothetical protein